MAVCTVSLKRSLGFSAIGGSVVFALALSACGGDGGDTQPTIIIQPSTFSTIVSTTAPASQSGQPASDGGTVAGTQVYEVRSGDFLAAIADEFGVPPESIANFNQWDEGVTHMLHPGDMINIPPGARAPDSGDDEDEESSADDEESDQTEEDEESREVDADDPPTCPDGSPQGVYTIEAGDIPARVAQSLDVTLDQLNEANANTPGFRNFVVGTDILVPCGDED